jgi:hypothetical protein
VHKLFADAVEDTNRDLARFEAVKRFAVHGQRGGGDGLGNRGVEASDQRS